MKDSFSTESVSAIIRRGNPQSSPGLSGLRFYHLQEAMTPDVGEAIGQLSRIIFEGSHLPNSFRQLHTGANLSVIGKKARPMTCGDVLQRISTQISVVSTAKRSRITSYHLANTGSQSPTGQR